MKNQFFSARQPREEILEFHSCSGFIFMTEFGNFAQLFQNNGIFFQKIFWLKSSLMFSTLAGLMGSGIRESCKYSIVLGSPIMCLSQTEYLDISSLICDQIVHPLLCAFATLAHRSSHLAP